MWRLRSRKRWQYRWKALNIVTVSLASRFKLIFCAALLIAAFAAACGGSSDADPTPTVRGSSETTSELSRAAVIALETSVETEYYTVEGQTTEAIFGFIEREGPTDGEGKRGSGLTSVTWGYEWEGGPESGDCSIRSMTISAEIVVTLPRHVAPDTLPQQIGANWDSYAAGVAEHEQRHIDIYEQGAQELKQRMKEIGAFPSCDALENEIKRVWAEEQSAINERQSEFHDQEFERLSGQREPLAAQIDANRARIDDLSAQIRALDEFLTTKRSEIESLATSIEEVDAQIRAVNESSGSLPDKQAQLTVLVQQRNALQSAHNAAVDEHNRALGDREALVAQRSQLIGDTNELVELFNWTR